MISILVVFIIVDMNSLNFFLLLKAICHQASDPIYTSNDSTIDQRLIQMLDDLNQSPINYQNKLKFYDR